MRRFYPALRWCGGVLPESIQRALAIDPEHGSTYLDAEHIVILMQENRSFDHAFGALQGVRGFNDPRAISLPNGHSVWFQTDEFGDTYAPFRLNMHGTKATWMGSLPHGYPTQVDARNNGHYDKWLPAKKIDDKRYEKMPLTMGYYNRQDIPFYYALADAFTVADQNFCSSLTGTTPNRCHLWSGTVRQEQSPSAFACVRNDDLDYGREVSWTTLPERLYDHGVSWKVYQNEISMDNGFDGDEDAWLSSFGDNPLEWYSQYRVRFAPARRAQVTRLIGQLPGEIEKLQHSLTDSGADKAKIQTQIDEKTKALADLKKEQAEYTNEAWAALSQRDRDLHEQAFAVNRNDPGYRRLTTLKYTEDGQERTVKVPEGDVFHQFRADVSSGKLPAVSWIVAPESYSDHPSSAWYGAWYVSEALDILTKNPEVWKKTIFILCYDENDGYFDHVPPFVPPHPSRPETGKVSEGIDTGLEYVELASDASRYPMEARESPIGLGFRVPLVVASPWSRGGCVNSEVCDHTSIIRLVEDWVTHRTGKPLVETNISSWRRTVCGNLASMFRPYHGEKISTPPFPPQREFIEGIHKAQFRGLPTYGKVNSEQISHFLNTGVAEFPVEGQEKGIRPACALPYELYVDAVRSATGVEVRFSAAKSFFGDKSAGAPFTLYAYQHDGTFKTRAYAVKAGDQISDAWSGDYLLRVDGPNGFLRRFHGLAADPSLDVHFGYEKGQTGNLEVVLKNTGRESVSVDVQDLVYNHSAHKIEVPAGAEHRLVIDTRKHHGWYDVSVLIAGHPHFLRQAAGHVETGRWSFTDPLMGKVL